MDYLVRITPDSATEGLFDVDEAVVRPHNVQQRAFTELEPGPFLGVDNQGIGRPY